jgi:hypothetical protein
MRLLVLTVDHEIFGNGAGDVRQHAVEPLERMATVCARHAVPLTVFFEAEEYVAFERHADPLRGELGYDPARLMREQVIRLARQGHDFQLHLHPEWHGARREDGRWVLRDDQPTVDSLFAAQPETTRYIAERKHLLDTLLAEAGSARRVCAYRAGAFSAQPGMRLLTALAENGMVIDSSVVKGLHRRDGPGALDYRNAPPRKRLWRVSRAVAEEDAGGRVWEIPIHSVMRRRLHQATWSRLKAKFSRHVPRAQQERLARQLGLSRNPVKLARFLWQRVPIKLDYHNLSPRQLLRWIKAIPPVANDPLDVVVLIGHTKEHLSDRALDALLAGIQADPGLRVVSLHDVARDLSTAPAPQPATP